MRRFGIPVLLIALLFGQVAGGASPAQANNAMGYQLMSEQEAAGLPRSHGALGISAARAQQIADADMKFDILRVTAVKPGSAAARAGLHLGDQIIAVDGRVFASLKAFAGYVGSLAPGSVATFDYMPSGGGPDQAQRVTITVGNADRPTQPPNSDGQAEGGLSAAAKSAIGAGAVALFGCYTSGCFSHHDQPAPTR